MLVFFVFIVLLQIFWVVVCRALPELAALTPMGASRLRGTGAEELEIFKNKKRGALSCAAL
jgi:hypothetical protein